MIGGKVKENVELLKKVGLFEATVLSINPNREELKELLGIDLTEDSKQTDYLSESKEGNTKLRVTFWLKHIKSNFKTNVTFFLEDKWKENKTEEGDGKEKKFQFINNIGTCSWATDRDNLPDWFTKREFRKAFVGEEELYNFVRTWLGKIDYKDPDAVLQLDWKDLMKGKIKTLQEQIGGEYCTPVVCMATVRTAEKDGEMKEYQGVWNKQFLPSYTLKQFRVMNYNDPNILAQLRKKEEDNKNDKTIRLFPHERFVLNATGDYGIKDFYKFQDLKDYDPSENIMSVNEPLVDENGDELPF